MGAALLLALIAGACPQISGSNDANTTEDVQQSAQQNTSGALTIFSVTPNLGSTSGGTVVTITGSGFVAGMNVSFGDTPASDVTVQQSWSLQATTPGGVAGPVAVTLTQGTSSATLANAFRDVVPSLAVYSITPTEGAVAGGTARVENGTMKIRLYRGLLSGHAHGIRAVTRHLRHSLSTGPQIGSFHGKRRIGCSKPAASLFSCAPTNPASSMHRGG